MPFSRWPTWLNRTPARKRSRKPAALRQRPMLQPLEERNAPAVFTVTNVLDNTFDQGNGRSLRQAIREANENPGFDQIVFDIPTNPSQPRVFSIRVATQLPALTDPAGVSIDATTQPGFDKLQQPVIELTGAFRNPGTPFDSGFTLAPSSANNVIRGFTINSFPFAGIDVNGSDNNIIVGNWIGTDINGKTGTDPLNDKQTPNGFLTNQLTPSKVNDLMMGQLVLRGGASDNVVGGTADINGLPLVQIDGKPIAGSLEVNRNVISGSPETTLFGNAPAGLGTGPGLRIQDAGTERNLIQGNLIGTDSEGNPFVGLENHVGVEIYGGAHENYLGHPDIPDAMNVIRFNDTQGVRLGPNTFPFGPIEYITRGEQVLLPNLLDTLTPDFYEAAPGIINYNATGQIGDGSPGTALYVSGVDLQTTRSATVGGVTADFEVLNRSLLKIIIPPGAPTGLQSVVIQSDLGTAALNASVRVFPATSVFPNEVATDVILDAGGAVVQAGQGLPGARFQLTDPNATFSTPEIARVFFELTDLMGMPQSVEGQVTVIDDTNVEIRIPSIPTNIDLDPNQAVDVRLVDTDGTETTFASAFTIQSEVIITPANRVLRDGAGTPGSSFELIDRAADFTAPEAARVFFFFNGESVEANFEILSSTRLQIEVPDTVNTGLRNLFSLRIVDATGNERIYFEGFAVIASEGEGVAGSAFAFRGSGLQGIDQVFFELVDDDGNLLESVQAAFQVVDDSELQITVPNTVAVGPDNRFDIRLVNGDGVEFTFADSFVVTSDQAPNILSLSPGQPRVGRPITIYGSNLFGTTELVINGQVTPFEIGEFGTRIFATIPEGAQVTGNVVITNPGGTDQVPLNLAEPVVPSIDSFKPAGEVGDLIGITGKGLTGVIEIVFEGSDPGERVFATEFELISDNRLEVVVPKDAQTGPITISTLAGSASTDGILADIFTVFESDPVRLLGGSQFASGPVGTSVTLVGTHLFGAQALVFLDPDSGRTLGVDTPFDAYDNPDGFSVGLPFPTYDGLQYPLNFTMPRLLQEDPMQDPSRYPVEVPYFGPVEILVVLPGIPSTFANGPKVAYSQVNIPSAIIDITGTLHQFGTANTVGETFFLTADPQPIVETIEVGGGNGTMAFRSTDPNGSIAGREGVVNPGRPPSEEFLGNPHVLAAGDLFTLFADPGFGAQQSIVSLTGAGFTSVTSIQVGNAPVNVFDIVNDNQILFAVPGAAPGEEQPVTLITSNGLQAEAPQALVIIDQEEPIIDGVSWQGPIAWDNMGTPEFGGTQGSYITIRGDNFVGTNLVTIDGNPADFRVVNDEQIVAIAPPSGVFSTEEMPAAVTVGVLTPSGGAFNDTDLMTTPFDKLSDPTVDDLIIGGVSKTNGLVGDRVLIIGENLYGVTAGFTTPLGDNTVDGLDVTVDPFGGFVFVTVPDGSETGSITLTNSKGQVTTNITIDEQLDPHLALLRSVWDPTTSPETFLPRPNAYPLDVEIHANRIADNGPNDRGVFFFTGVPIVPETAYDPPTGNDLFDSDGGTFSLLFQQGGANRVQNYPLLQIVQSAVDRTNFPTALVGQPFRDYRVDYFLNAADSELLSDVYLGSIYIYTDDQGFGAGLFVLRAEDTPDGDGPLPLGSAITAVVTDLTPGRSTSPLAGQEISQPFGDGSSRISVSQIVDPATGAIAGAVFFDIDGDGMVEAGEPPLQGITIEIDLDDDGTIDVTQKTDAQGEYNFSQATLGGFGLPNGTHRVTAIPQFGFEPTNPASGSQLVTIIDGEQIPGINFLHTDINDPPIATPDSYMTLFEQTLVVNAPGILRNDVDPDDDPLTVVDADQITLASGQGELTVNADGSFTYVPATGFSGTATFEYAATDGEFDTAPVTVTIEVGDPDDLPPGFPMAVNDDFQVLSGQTLNVTSPGLLSNDSDPDGDPISVFEPDQITLVQGDGTLTVNANGSFRYVPPAGFIGTSQFIYTITDGINVSNNAVVSIEVLRVNQPPMLNNASFSLPENSPAGTVVGTLMATDPDMDQTLTYSIVLGNLDGGFSIDPSTGVLQVADASVLDFETNPVFQLTVSVRDDGLPIGIDQALVTVSLTNVEEPPVIIDDQSFEVVAGAPAGTPVGAVSVSDSDAGTMLTFAITGGNDTGAFTIDPTTGVISVVSPANLVLGTTFMLTIQVSDNTGLSDTATVPVNVVAEPTDPTNTPPVAVNDVATTGLDTPVVIDVLANDSDADGDPLTIAMTSTPTGGSVVIATDGKSLTFTPDSGFVGATSFTYTIRDGRGGSALATVSVTVSETPGNQPPVAVDDTFSLVQGSPLTTLDVLTNDSDPENDPLTITAVSPATNGSVAIATGSQSLTYQPNANFIGVDSFTYTIEDGQGGTATATVTVAVTGPDNQPPMAVDDGFNILADGPSRTLSVLTNDSDPDGDPLTITNVSTPSSGTAILTPNNRQVIYTPAPGFIGTATFTYTITDGRGGIDSANVTLVLGEASSLPVDQNEVEVYTVTGGPGSPNQVSIYGAGDQIVDEIIPFEFNVPGGLRSVAADVNGDGTPDIVVGTGPGVSSQVRVFDGLAGTILYDLSPFEASFTGGVYVSAGDFDADGLADIIITPDEGGGPRVRIFRGSDGVQMVDYFGIEDPNFRGGVRPSVGDFNGDGRTDLVVAAGFSGGPRVAIWDGASLPSGNPTKLVADFFVFEPGLRDGSFVAAGDIDGDGNADLVVGGGPGGGPRVRAFSGALLIDPSFDPLNPDATSIANFFAGDPNNRGGVRVAVKNLNNDGRADLVTGAGTDASPQVISFSGATIPEQGTPPTLDSFLAFGEDFVGGVFVG